MSTQEAILNMGRFFIYLSVLVFKKWLACVKENKLRNLTESGPVQGYSTYNPIDYLTHNFNDDIDSFSCLSFFYDRRFPTNNFKTNATSSFCRALFQIQ
jgi:hypothetical protein